MSQNLKNKAPLWLWAILFAIIIIVPILLVLHFLAVIDLTILSDLFLGYFMWGSLNLVNAIVAIVLPIGFGTLIGYTYVTYVKGMKLGRNTITQGTTTVLQGAPIQTQAFPNPTPAPIIQNVDEKEK